MLWLTELKDFRSCFRRCVLTGVTKCLRQFGCAEHVGEALEVVSQCRNADFGSCTGQPRISRRGCPKMRYLIVAKGCSTVLRRSLIASGVTRSCIRLARHRTDGEPSHVSEPACSVTSANSATIARRSLIHCVTVLRLVCLRSSLLSGQT
jgi:hypothetical protein